jgi:hypothetical protein
MHDCDLIRPNFGWGSGPSLPDGQLAEHRSGRAMKGSKDRILNC